jgi:hypothetical protein
MVDIMHRLFVLNIQSASSLVAPIIRRANPDPYLVIRKQRVLVPIQTIVYGTMVGIAGIIWLSLGIAVWIQDRRFGHVLFGGVIFAFGRGMGRFHG